MHHCILYTTLRQCINKVYAFKQHMCVHKHFYSIRKKKLKLKKTHNYIRRNSRKYQHIKLYKMLQCNSRQNSLVQQRPTNTKKNCLRYNRGPSLCGYNVWPLSFFYLIDIAQVARKKEIFFFRVLIFQWLDLTKKICLINLKFIHWINGNETNTIRTTSTTIV